MRPLMGFCLQIINVDRRNLTAIETVICQGRHHGNSIFFLLFSYIPTKIACLGNLFQKLSKRGQEKNNFLTDFSLLSCSHCKCAQFQPNTYYHSSSHLLLTCCLVNYLSSPLEREKQPDLRNASWFYYFAILRFKLKNAQKGKRFSRFNPSSNVHVWNFNNFTYFPSGFNNFTYLLSAVYNFTYLSSGFLLHQHFTHITAQGVTAGTWSIRWLVDRKTKNFAFFQIQRCRSSEHVDQR